MKTGLWRGLRAGHRPYLYPSFLPAFQFCRQVQKFPKIIQQHPLLALDCLALEHSPARDLEQFL